MEDSVENSFGLDDFESMVRVFTAAALTGLLSTADPTDPEALIDPVFIAKEATEIGWATAAALEAKMSDVYGSKVG